MKSILKKIILFFVVLIVFSCQENDNEYVKYIPLTFNGKELTKIPKMMTEKHQENVIKVLKYYDEKWKVENGKLLVSRKIDNEILWNYTSKANDSIWLSKHKPK